MDMFLDIGAIAALYIAAAIFASSRPYALLYSGSATPHSGGARRKIRHADFVRGGYRD